MSSISRNVARVFGLALLFSVLGASATRAQIGGLVKRATKRAATEAVAEKAGSAVGAKSGRLSPAIYGEEITADTLDMLLAGLAAAAEQMTKVEALYKRHQELNNQLGDHRSKSYAAREQYTRQTEKTNDCYDKELTAINKSREGEMQQRIMAVSAGNSKFAQEYASLAQQASQAVARGDSAGAQRITDKMYKELFGIDFKADSAKVKVKCGAFPPKPAVLVEEERLEQGVADAADALRDAESASRDAGVKESHIPAERFALARERLTTWYRLDNSGQADKQFSKNEHQLFSSRKADISRVSKALR